jgi:hypothetical protein
MGTFFDVKAQKKGPVPTRKEVVDMPYVPERSPAARVVSENGDDGVEYEYFIDRFDMDTRAMILGLAAEFGADAEEYIFMLRRPTGKGPTRDPGVQLHARPVDTWPVSVTSPSRKSE